MYFFTVTSDKICKPKHLKLPYQISDRVSLIKQELLAGRPGKIALRFCRGATVFYIPSKKGWLTINGVTVPSHKITVIAECFPKIFQHIIPKDLQNLIASHKPDLLQIMRQAELLSSLMATETPTEAIDQSVRKLKEEILELWNVDERLISALRVSSSPPEMLS